MRFVLSFLMFSIILSGYMAAAHAFEPVSKEQTQISLCDGCQPDNSNDTSDNGDSPIKNCDMGCHTCCSIQAAFSSSNIIGLPKVANKLAPMYETKLAGYFLFSLLRPPRILV